ncbi:DUF3168 domain-containing protein [Novosphingobium profundi]|uniref:DUF3168 domain-containing protein n=1 Tax=Novosphingobium profundi TaxID=1774954 RepID=UPI001BDA8DBC|nr:DUF3168 domain-containing protein [Novosphingobium profundi]MBT0667775.1 DUF3168 domain-containing protein [Novosphingobium profundi]
MEELFRAALVDWLRADTMLAASLNAITEEAPARAALPWLALSASSSADWSGKTHEGREVRVALELQCRGDVPGAAAALVGQIEARIAELPDYLDDLQLVTTRFLRARSEQRSGNRRAVLLEYAFRLILES